MWLFKKKVEPILKDEDVLELKGLERQSYMEEARKIMILRGQIKAKSDLEIKPLKPKESKWQI